MPAAFARTTFIAALLAAAAAGALLAAPPTKTELRQKVQEFYGIYEGMPENPTAEDLEAFKKRAEAKAAELLKGVEIAELDAEGRDAIMPLVMSSPTHKAAMMTLLEAEAAKPDADGFAATCTLVDFAGPDEAERTKWTTAAIEHSGAVAGIAAGRGMTLGWVLSDASDEVLKAHAERLAAFCAAFGPDAKDEAFYSASPFLKAAQRVLPKDRFDALRSAAAGEAGARAAKATDERLKKNLTRLAAALNGAAMRGELIGHAAPTLTFRKVYPGTGEETWANLADLKGKVVVLDFWATWCGPCVGSFPQVKEMRAAYSPSDVAIVGVTSIQGFISSKSRGKIDCANDPAKEEAELASYLKEMDVTWSVAISEQDVYNPDFGINGIPFVAILDREGKVVKAGLHPMNHDEITRIVDELLGKPAATKTTAAEGAGH